MISKKISSLNMLLRVFLKPRPILKTLKLIWETKRKRRSWHESKDMQPRIEEVLSCPDLAKIPVVSGAGTIEDGVLTMHNGLKVITGSYSGNEMTRLMNATKGIHEPQEELAFANVLEMIKPGSTMLELGAWWGFYSMWFQKNVPQAKNFLVEPEKENLEFGKDNFKLNNMQGNFLQGFISDKSYELDGEVSKYCIDDLFDVFSITELNILHSDIQGYEVNMLKGAAGAMNNRSIDYFFISTHSNQLHYQCLEILESFDYSVLADADMLDTYSLDGVIVAGRKEITGLKRIGIATH